MRRLLAGLGNAVLFIVLAPLLLVMLILVVAGVAVAWVVQEILATVRREPRVRLPDTGVVLVGRPDAETSREFVAAAILSRCSAEVARHAGEGPQAGFRDLPGRAATDAELTRHLKRTRARQDEH